MKFNEGYNSKFDVLASITMFTMLGAVGIVSVAAATTILVEGTKSLGRITKKIVKRH